MSVWPETEKGTHLSSPQLQENQAMSAWAEIESLMLEATLLALRSALIDPSPLRDVQMIQPTPQPTWGTWKVEPMESDTQEQASACLKTKALLDQTTLKAPTKAKNL